MIDTELVTCHLDVASDMHILAPKLNSVSLSSLPDPCLCLAYDRSLLLLLHTLLCMDTYLDDQVARFD
jgi:hypothetical protein